MMISKQLPSWSLALSILGWASYLALVVFRISWGRYLFCLILGSLLAAIGVGCAVVWFARTRKSEITWMELTAAMFGFLSGLGMLLLLLVAVLPATGGTQDLARVSGDFVLLETAIMNYRNTYGRWPSRRTEGHDVRYGPGTQKELIDILEGRDPLANPKKIMFAVFDSKSVRDGQLVDPWGVAYHLVLDGNQDEQCVIGPGKASVHAGIVIWSDGSGLTLLRVVSPVRSEKTHRTQAGE